MAHNPLAPAPCEIRPKRQERQVWYVSRRAQISHASGSIIRSVSSTPDCRFASAHRSFRAQFKLEVQRQHRILQVQEEELMTAQAQEELLMLGGGGGASPVVQLLSTIQSLGCCSRCTYPIMNAEHRFCVYCGKAYLEDQ
ncbi:unnamed protein product [Polarella glacialis]|uniref:Uncharacterized protein n=1 Tax=Polarella glacialis TaxID=89957 RepID=A0A813KFP6_POLGL|nr:unnamed protein product [Polarella glacialis]